MQALLLTAPGVLELVDLPRPDPGPGEVRIRVAACGICGSDVHGYTGETGRRIPHLVMGHEAAGTVEAVGAGITDLGPGDRVALDSTVFCGHCEFCRTGRENLCGSREVLGVSAATAVFFPTTAFPCERILLVRQSPPARREEEA